MANGGKSDIEMTDAPIPISPSDQLRKELSNQVTTISRATASETASIIVTKPIPYTLDLGHLLLNDANPIATDLSSEALHSIARDCAQALINQLLTACPIESAPDGVHISLPAPTSLLPREKPIPADKEPTKWELFAAKRGIKAKKREGKMVFDEASAEWVSRYGYRGKNKAGENDWLVEVDADKERRTGEPGDARTEKRGERMERIRRQERRQRANERRAGKKDG